MFEVILKVQLKLYSASVYDIFRFEKGKISFVFGILRRHLNTRLTHFGYLNRSKSKSRNILAIKTKRNRSFINSVNRYLLSLATWTGRTKHQHSKAIIEHVLKMRCK